MHLAKEYIYMYIVYEWYICVNNLKNKNNRKNKVIKRITSEAIENAIIDVVDCRNINIQNLSKKWRQQQQQRGERWRKMITVLF